MISKSKRQAIMLDIIKLNKVERQSDFVSLLLQEGVDATQSSVSRDIRELGLIKRGGRYVQPSDGEESLDVNDLASKLGDFLKDVSFVLPNLVVLRSLPGTAHSIGMMIDQLDWPEIAGTVAGDDTLFVAVFNEDSGYDVTRRLKKIMKG